MRSMSRSLLSLIAAATVLFTAISVFADDKELLAPTPAEKAIATCEKTLSVGALYSMAQDRLRQGRTEEETQWSELKKDLLAEGLKEDEISLIEGAEYLRPILVSGLLEDAVRIALLSAKIPPKQLGSALDYAKAHALPTEQIEEIVDRTLVVLQKINLQPVSKENLGHIENIRKKYKLSIQVYQALSDAINASSESAQMKLRLGILSVFLQGDQAFIQHVAEPGFVKMWLSKRDAKRVVLPKKQLPEPPMPELPPGEIKTTAQKLAHLRAVFGDPSLLNMEKRYALLNSLEDLVDREKVFSTSDILLMLRLMPFGANWGKENYSYGSGWLGKPWTGFDPSDLRILCKFIRKVKVSNNGKLPEIQKEFLNALEQVYQWGTKATGFKRDIYDLVNAEFARISELKKEE